MTLARRLHGRSHGRGEQQAFEMPPRLPCDGRNGSTEREERASIKPSSMTARTWVGKHLRVKVAFNGHNCRAWH